MSIMQTISTLAGMDEDGLIPVVVQICQKMAHRKSDKTSIRVDLYKVNIHYEIMQHTAIFHG